MPCKETLSNFPPRYPFFIGIDSDGSVFNTMEMKHKECFCPVFIEQFHLEKIKPQASEVWDYINLYSKFRGINRFPGLIMVLDILRKRPDTRNFILPEHQLNGLKNWLGQVKSYSEQALREEVEKTGNPDLIKVLSWSEESSRRIEKAVEHISPFNWAGKAIPLMADKADLVVVSQASPGELQREWEENGLIRYVRATAGQDLGSKTEHLKTASENRYENGKKLMIGDAPGDLKAAQANNALFYPIIPGREESSWKRFIDDALARFTGGSFDSDYQADLLMEFDKALPSAPSWEKSFSNAPKTAPDVSVDRKGRV